MTDTTNNDDSKVSLGDAIVGQNKGIDFDVIQGVKVTFSAILGSTNMLISDLLQLKNGCIVQINKNVGDHIDIMINNKLVAKGDLVVKDNKVGVILKEIIHK